MRTMVYTYKRQKQEGWGAVAKAILDLVQFSNNISMKMLKEHIKCRMLKDFYYKTPIS